MPWSPPPFTEGVVWENDPSHLTSLSAENFNATQAGQASYAQEVGQSVIDALESGDFTPIADLGLNGFRLTGVGDATADTDVMNRRSGDSRYPAATGTDPYGRTRLIHTLGGNVGLPHYVTVEDFDQAQGPDLGDAFRVADGVMTAGSNALSSASFAGRVKEGHRVEVTNAAGQGFNADRDATATLKNVSSVTGLAVGNYVAGGGVAPGTTILSIDTSVPANLKVTLSAIPTGGVATGVAFSAMTGNLAGWIHLVGGSPTVVTTKGGTTPLNAGFSSTDATAAGLIVYVTVGSMDNDKATFQATNDAVENGGGGMIGMYPWKAYMLYAVVPGNLGKGNVTFTGAFGGKATVYADPADTAGGKQTFRYQPASSVGTAGANGIRIENISFPGHGYERQSQYPMILQQAIGATVSGCYMSNFSANGIYIRDTTRAKVLHNTLDNVCNEIGGGNAINMVSGANGDLTPLTDFLVDGNTLIGGGPGEGIACVTATNSASSATVAGRVVNNYINRENDVGAGIFFEGGSAAVPNKDIVIANNIVKVNKSTTTPQTAIIVDNDSAASSPDSELCGYYVIQGNDASGAMGILAQGSYIAVVGNAVSANGSYGIQVAGSGGGSWTVTGSATNGSTIVTGIAIPVSFTYNASTTSHPTWLTSASNMTNLRRGTALTGPGIPVGATVVGLDANANTIILSAAATSNQTGATITSATQPLFSIRRGQLVTATGFTTSTYVQEGGSEASTWTMSNAFTGTTGAVTLSVSNPGFGTICADNAIVMDANFTNYALRFATQHRGLCSENIVTCKPGNTAGATGLGMQVNFTNWCDIRGNRIEDAPTNGLTIANSNNVNVVGNHIRNPSAAAAGSSGIALTGFGGTLNTFENNRIVDDRAVHLMANSINGTFVNAIVTGNKFLGQTANPLSATTGIRTWRNNDMDTPAWSFVAPATATLIGSGGPNWWFLNTSPFPIHYTQAGGTNTLIGFMRGYNTTLSGALATGAAITSLPVATTRDPIPDGTVLTIYSASAGVLSTQNWTVSNGGNPVPAGSTAIPVTSQTPSFAFPSGSLVSSATVKTMGNPSNTMTGVPMMPGDAIQGTSSANPGTPVRIPILY